MKKFILILFIIFPLQIIAVETGISDKKKIIYEVFFDNAVHHEAQINAIFSGLPEKPLEIVMSCSSPGYYIFLPFAKNVYNVKAFNSKGDILKITQYNEHQWNIEKHDGAVIFSYTLYADRMDGTYSSITPNQILLNIPSAFVWAKGLENVPISLKIKNPSDKLKIITQLIPADKPGEFTAPDLGYFIDSPVEIANFDIEEWDVESNGKKQKFILACNHKGTKDEVETFARMIEAVIHEQISLFGELPSFDYGRYTFIANYIPEVIFDGMEHRNSTILTTSASLDTSSIRNLRTLSHELFHAWESERIRPKTLEPFNLEKTNMSDELWFVEGFPTYYQDLTVYRAGLINLDEYGEIIKSRFDYVYNNPRDNFHSLVEMSQRSPFYNGGVYEDPVNKENIYISYYSYGGVIALGLDMMLRTQFENITLDDYMKAIWNRYGKTEIPYTNKDLKNLLTELTKDEKFSDDFFIRYIYGKELPDLTKLLSNGGFQVRKMRPGEAALGRKNTIKFENDTAIISEPTILNEALYTAGLDKGDIIVKIDDKLVVKEDDLKNILKARKPWDTVNIEFKRRDGEIITGTIKLEEDRELEIVPYEMIFLPVTPEIVSFRKNWLGSKSGFQSPDLVKKDPQSDRIFPFEYNYCPNTGRKLVIRLKSKMGKI